MATVSVSQAQRRDWRLIIWRVVAGLGALLFLVGLPGALALIEPWVLVAPDQPGYSAEIHRFHEAHWGVIHGMLYAGCLLALLRRPREQPLLVQFFVVAVLIEAVGYGLVGALDPMLLIISAIVIAAYPAPRTLLSVSREGLVSVPLLGLSVLAAALLLPEVGRLVPMQLAGLGGEHATEHHWILTAILEVMLIAGGLLAATRRPGWKALGIIIGLAFVYLGVASISLPYYAGSWNVWGGVLATIGGCAFIGATIWAIRRPSGML
jgi:F0F1-type ATP synthase membrane subunit c/vacuolar-type H+-ATPase subunit K